MFPLINTISKNFSAVSAQTRQNGYIVCTTSNNMQLVDLTVAWCLTSCVLLMKGNEL